MQQISPVARPAGRSWGELCQQFKKKDTTSHRWHHIKLCPWGAVNKVMKASWQKSTTFDCKKPMSSAKSEWASVQDVYPKHTVGISPSVHRSGAEQTLGTELGTPFCRAGAWQRPSQLPLCSCAHISFHSKGEAEVKSKSEEYQSLHKYLGSIFLTRRVTATSRYEHHRWRDKLIKRLHILEFLNDRV